MEPMRRFAQAVADRPTLRTPRLVLRRPAARDLTAIADICGDREVSSRLVQVPHPYGEDEARFFLDVIVPAQLVWVVVERASGQVVGVVGFSRSEDMADMVEFGYYVARARWGEGIATEAGAVALAYGIGLLDAARIRSRYFQDNPSSGRVLDKLGFAATGVSDCPCLATGTDRPAIEMLYRA